MWSSPKRTYLSWINDDLLLYEIEDLTQFIEQIMRNNRPKKHYVDPLKGLFEQSLFGRIENPRQRNAMNSLSNSLFHFHKNILASSDNNWMQIGPVDSIYGIFDLVDSDRMEFAKVFRLVSASLDINFREILVAAADPKINKIYLVGNDDIFHRFKRYRSQNQKNL